MQTQPTIEPAGSPVPGVMPEPVRVHHDPVAAHARLIAAPTLSKTTEPASSPGRRNPASVLLAKLLSVIRGDKYMANPPDWHSVGAARDGGDVIRQHHDGQGAPSAAVASEPNTAGHSAPAASPTKER
jgi:hypothetical protein